MNMKYIKILLLAAAASLAFACGKQDYPAFEFGPQDDTTGKVEVYFPITSANLAIEPTDSSIVIPLARTETTGALSVPLVVGDPTGLFEVPATAEFEDGAAATTIKIGLLKLEMEVPYVLSITVGGDNRYLYKKSSAASTYCSFHFEVLKQKWEDAGTCDFYDNFWDTTVGEAEGLKIQNHSGTADYRIVAPYAVAYPADFPDGAPNFLFSIDKDDDGNNVIVPKNGQDFWGAGAALLFMWDPDGYSKYCYVDHEYSEGEHSFAIGFLASVNGTPSYTGELGFTWHDCPVEFPIPEAGE